MNCRYHPGAQKDVYGILDYYDSISPELGDAFYGELLEAVAFGCRYAQSIQESIRTVQKG
jgi:hypothetical protein